MSRVTGRPGRRSAGSAPVASEPATEASFEARRVEIRERLRALVRRQRERTRQGRHAEAEEALRERRYLEFVLQVLGLPEPHRAPAARN